jgi:periplasmic protein TonB
MREPALGLKTSLLNGGPFLKRIRENLQSVWRLPWVPLPAAHAPIHLLEERRRSYSPSTAQIGSTLMHVGICAALLWSIARPLQNPLGPPPELGRGPLPPIPQWLLTAETGSLGRRGESGGRDTLPPTNGQLAPETRFALIRPHLSDSRPHPLAVQVTIANVDAPEFVRATNDLGLPWMPTKNGSEGSGENGVGNGKHHGMGDGPGDGVGIGADAGPFGAVASQVICRVCPDPLYSDEARKTKVQGSVLLSVLVGADGRAKEVRVIRGLGSGLDENAMQAVRNWQFIPAKDAAQHSVASWIRIETVFRLF